MSSWLDCFTVVDFETSGVDADVARVLEIGLARFEQGRLVERCDYTVSHQGMMITAETTEHTGLRQEHFYDADGVLFPTFPETWPKLCDLFRDAVPVAYNASFDRRFLQAELRRHRGPWPTSVLDARHITQIGSPWLDPLPFVRSRDKFKKGKKLVNACERRGIVLEHAHRAVDDAVATGELLVHLWQEGAVPLDTAAALSVMAGYRTEQEYEREAYIASQNGQSIDGGVVYACDACDGTAFVAHSSKLPEGWSSHGEMYTCSMGCDAQLLWWRAAAQIGAVLEH